LVIGSGRGGDLPMGGRKIGKLIQRGHQIAFVQVRIAIHRRFNARMPSQCLCDLGMYTSGCQIAHECVPQCVEICKGARFIDGCKKIALFGPRAMLRRPMICQPCISSIN